MAVPHRFALFYDPAIQHHLRAIERKYHGLIQQKIEGQLLHEPAVPARNRKPLEEPTEMGEALWVLRFGPANRFRVFYEVDMEKQRVMIHAIGVKLRNRLFIGGKEITL